MPEILIDCKALTRAQKKTLSEALSDVAVSDMPLKFELLFVSEEEIRALNARMRGVDRVTDVLSFPALEGIKGREILSDEHGECLDEEGALLVGSVVICKKRAKEQAAEYGHSAEREIGYLAVHGVLHCLGYDHETEEERAEMRAKEEEIMQKLRLGRGE